MPHSNSRIATPNKSECAFQGKLSVLWALLSLQGDTLLRLPPPKSLKIFHLKGQRILRERICGGARHKTQSNQAV